MRYRSASSTWRHPRSRNAKGTSASAAARRSNPSSRRNPMHCVVQPRRGLPRIRMPKRRTIAPTKYPTGRPSARTTATTASAPCEAARYSSQPALWYTSASAWAATIASHATGSNGTRSRKMPRAPLTSCPGITASPAWSRWRQQDCEPAFEEQPYGAPMRSKPRANLLRYRQPAGSDRRPRPRVVPSQSV